MDKTVDNISFLHVGKVVVPKGICSIEDLKKLLIKITRVNSRPTQVRITEDNRPPILIEADLPRMTGSLGFTFVEKRALESTVAYLLAVYTEKDSGEKHIILIVVDGSVLEEVLERLACKEPFDIYEGVGVLVDMPYTPMNLEDIKRLNEYAFEFGNGYTNVILNP